MSLVNYSDSDSESSSAPSPPRKKVARSTPTTSTKTTSATPSSLPPLPASFHSLYASSTRVSTKDDPSLHAGRKRAIPHIEGNWPTHLYLEWVPSKEEVHLLADLIQAADTNGNSNVNSNSNSSTSANSTSTSKKENGPDPNSDSDSTVHSLLHSDLGAQLPLHISLSRPVILRTEQRISFAESLSKSVLSSNISPFHVNPQTLKWVSNYEKTRWFLVLRVSKPKSDNLNRLLKLCNEALDRFGQPPLYAGTGHASSGSDGDFSACFHISIAWRLKEPDAVEMERVEKVDLDKIRTMDVLFRCVKAKIGNYVEVFDLPVRK